MLLGVTKRTRDMSEEFKVIERQAMGPAEPPRRVEVGSEGSGFDNPPMPWQHETQCQHGNYACPFCDV